MRCGRGVNCDLTIQNLFPATVARNAADPGVFPEYREWEPSGHMGAHTPVLPKERRPHVEDEG
jgi:hypothetical protein